MPSQSLAETAILSEAYALLGMDADMVTVVCESMQLRFCPNANTLLLHDAYMSQSGWSESVTAVLLDIWRLPSFCASRWTTVGTGCRRLCLAIATGLHHCLKTLHEQSHLSHYSFHGFERYSTRVGMFSVVAGVSAYLPDSLLKAVLHEPALCKIFHECEADLEEEFLYLQQISGSAWDLIARHFASDGDSLRHLCLSSTHTTWAYIEWKVLSVAASLPWSLCLGDLEANLSDLCGLADPPSELISHRIWQLSKLGVQRSVLLHGLRALASSSWTSQ
eukprot:3145605-Amphidinium_carterae.1